MAKKLLFLPLLCLAACAQPENGGAAAKGDKNSPNAYMSLAVLEVRYDADASTISGRAALWNDSVTVLLPNGLFFNDKPAPLVDVPGRAAHYRYEGKSPDAPDRYAFTFLSPKKENYRFEGDMPVLDSLRVGANVSVSEPLTVRWEGRPLAEDEAMHVLLTDAARNVRQVILDGPTKTPSVTFPADQFKGLQPGKAELTALRQAIREENVQGVRVKATLSYYARRVNVLLAK